MNEPRHIRTSEPCTTSAARDNVLDHLGAAYERHCEAEQMARAQNDKVAEERAHNAVVWVLRAYRAEEG